VDGYSDILEVVEIPMKPIALFKAAVQRVAGHYGYRVQRTYDLGKYRLDVLELLLSSEQKSSEFFFVQVGAHDGSDNLSRFIRRNLWRGVLIEPQPEICKKLVENYGDQPQLRIENVAIGSTDRIMPMWTVKEDTSLASFDKTVLLRRGYNQRQLIEISVTVMSVQSLVRKYSIFNIDLLQIDTEGHDFTILKLFLEHTRAPPRIIIYEHLLLSDAERTECVQMLGGLGYLMIPYGDREIDTLAYRPVAATG
jgi:FkbM family methyltransferase